MDIQKTDTAVVFIDPQNDVLSEKGANWGSGRRERYREPHSREYGANLRGCEAKRL